MIKAEKAETQRHSRHPAMIYFYRYVQIARKIPMQSASLTSVQAWAI
jgi:hypothetical protein